MTVEADTPPQVDTFKRFVWETVVNFAWARAYWGRRMVGAVAGLMADALAEGTTQAFYARLPGHPHQAPDSLDQSGNDRDLFRFRGETMANWIARVAGSWDAYEQAGTSIQLLRVVNAWGTAGWPATWDDSLVTCVESGDPLDWSFILTIGYGCISPAWSPEVYGGGHTYGEPNFLYGFPANSDVARLRYEVRRWKRSASRCELRVYNTPSTYLRMRI